MTPRPVPTRTSTTVARHPRGRATGRRTATPLLGRTAA